MLINDLAKMADAYYETRQRRLAMQKDVDKLQEQETALRKSLIDYLSESEAEGVAGATCRVQLTKKEVPSVTDWDAFFSYVAARRQFDLLQRRVSDTAVKQRWEDGKKIPGVEKFQVTDLSVRKLGSN